MISDSAEPGLRPSGARHEPRLGAQSPLMSENDLGFFMLISHQQNQQLGANSSAFLCPAGQAQVRCKEETPF